MNKGLQSIEMNRCEDCHIPPCLENLESWIEADEKTKLQAMEDIEHCEEHV